ncbi:hypothetical protein EJB05_16004, partial [Eragrostis curvula]
MCMRSLLLRLLLTAVLLSSTANVNVDVEVTAEVSPLYYRCREDGGRYTSNSTYLSNLRTMYDDLIAKANFFPGTFGQAPDAVYGVVLCRGDYTGASCTDSLLKAFRSAVDKGFLCPLYKDVTIYYDQHMLRFSGDDFRQSRGTNTMAWVAWNMNHVTGDEGRRYGEKVRKLANVIIGIAARSPDRYATGEAFFQGKDASTVYGLVQCRPDLTADDCRSCLTDLVALMPAWFGNDSTGDHRVGGRIVDVRCNLRYEKELFFKETDATLKLDMPKDTRAQNELEEWTKLLASEIGSSFTLFTLSEIRKATDNFSEAKRLGEGAFGPVYRGQLSSEAVAIKRLAPDSPQGLPEFRNEISLIANLQHINLVKLIGCCMQHDENILVYEYMPNRSLDDVFSDVGKWASLTWLIRQNIIDGIAQGLLYIHSYLQSDRCIVHRDLKASNVLLDSQMKPKISDFGTARMFSSSLTELCTSRLMGTRGYMAPEYFFGNTFSVKSDVFSFGVLVLEIVSGRKVATSFRRYKRSDNLMAYAWRLWEDKNSRELIDNSLSIEEHDQEEEIIRCIQIALLCVQANPEDRPDMKEVVRMLSNKDIHLDNPKQPSYFNEPIMSIALAASNNQTPTEYRTAMDSHQLA